MCLFCFVECGIMLILINRFNKLLKRRTNFSMEEIKQYQIMVDETVRKLGGYWRPLSGLARLLEELGEINEIFLEKELDIQKLAEELADLFIISASIGNQYCMDLNKELTILKHSYKIDKLYQLPPNYKNPYQGLMEVASHCGQIGRIINHYEGDKKKKTTERSQRVAQEIAKLHLQLVQLSNYYQIKLFEVVEEVLKRDLKRDLNRFHITFDPTTASSLDRFKLLKEKQSRNSEKLWGSSDWDPEKGLKQNLLEALPTFVRFCKIALNEELDGFVLEVRGLQYVKTENRNEVINAVLSIFHQNDPLKEKEDTELGLLEGNYYFRFYRLSFDWVPYIKGESLFIVFMIK